MAASMQMERHLLNLKMYAKELELLSKKCTKEEAKEKVKCKSAIQKGTMEKARIYADNAIRQKNQGLEYLRLSARVDATASRLQSALSNRKVMSSIGGVCKTMEQAMKTMNLPSIAECLDKYESQFETLDVQSSFMENTMKQTTTTTVPQNECNQLLQKLADEAGIEFRQDLPSGGHEGIVGGPRPSTLPAAQAVDDDDLTARLAKLRMQ